MVDINSSVVGDDLLGSGNDLAQGLQYIIETALADDNQVNYKRKESGKITGIQLYVNSPKMGSQWQGAVGYTDLCGSEAITPQHPMRIASNTKTFVAAAILRLWEQQQLELDTSINAYISEQHHQLLTNNGYQLANISLRHLLTHTSGLFDYADSPEFADAISDDPQQHWTRTEQLQLAMEHGQPYGQPGEVYRYSDTGYILLGEIIERVYGQSLGLALRQLLNYQGLGLTSTWLEVDEPTPPNLLPRVHQYIADVDAYHTHGSFDIYGGGGLVSTVGDMARFMRGLFQGDIYSKPETLKTMLTTVPATRAGPSAYGGAHLMVPGNYRLGIDGGETGVILGHGGFFGTYAAYVPSRDLTISYSINQHHAQAERQALKTAVLALFGIVL